MKLYRYQVGQIYRGYQVFTQCYASSYAQAADMMGVSLHYLRSYGYKTDQGDPCDGVMAYIDSGEIIFQDGRKDLYRKLMPYDELKVIIEEFNKRKYGKLGL